MKFWNYLTNPLFLDLLLLFHSNSLSMVEINIKYNLYVCFFRQPKVDTKSAGENFFVSTKNYRKSVIVDGQSFIFYVRW